MIFQHHIARKTSISSSLWTCRMYPSPSLALQCGLKGYMHPFYLCKVLLKCWNAGLSGIRSVRCRSEQKCRSLNQSGTGITGLSPVPECILTGLRYRNRCRRHRSRYRCPAIVLRKLISWKHKRTSFLTPLAIGPILRP
jgi:hypothetical protein